MGTKYMHLFLYMPFCVAFLFKALIFMRFMGSMCVAGEDRLDPGRRWRTSRAMIEPIIGKDGAHLFPA